MKLYTKTDADICVRFDSEMMSLFCLICGFEQPVNCLRQFNTLNDDYDDHGDRERQVEYSHQCLCVDRAFRNVGKRLRCEANDIWCAQDQECQHDAGGFDEYLGDAREWCPDCIAQEVNIQDDLGEEDGVDPRDEFQEHIGEYGDKEQLIFRKEIRAEYLKI